MRWLANVGVVLVVVTAVVAVPVSSAEQAPPVPRTSTRLQQVSEDFEALVRQVSPSLVQILATGYAAISPDAPTGDLLSRQRAAGSGVILHPDGYILTNAHVVAGARRVRVVLPSSGGSGGDPRSIVRAPGRSLDAAIVGTDEETDLAVLKINERSLPALPLGDSDDLKQGNLVLAFGNPLGLDNSVSLGVVSAVGRQRAQDDPMVYIQTDAPINPGSSGGPLVDTTGRVVGINTFIMSQSGGSQGLGFAIPSNIVRTVFEQLRTGGRVRRGTLGVLVQTITPLLAAGLGLARTNGAIVADVDGGGPGSAAGLRAGDVVLTLDGKPMENARQFDVNLYRRRVGDTVTLEIQRGSETLRASAAIAERADDPARFADLVDPARNLVRRLGILAVEVDAGLAARLPPLRSTRGVLVAAQAAQAPAAEGGLESGDVIIAVNGTAVAGLDDFRSKIERLPSGAPCVLQVQRRTYLVYVVLEVD